MSAEVEALLARLDDISSRSGHEWNAAKDAAALIRAQVEEIASLRAPYSGNLDPRLNHKVIPTAGRVQVDAVSLGLLHQELDQLREQIAAASRQEPCAWQVVNKDGAFARNGFSYERSQDLVTCADADWPANAPRRSIPLYAAPIPTGDVLLSVDGKTYASPSVSELASGVPIPVANLKELSTIPAGDAVSVQRDAARYQWWRIWWPNRDENYMDQMTIWNADTPDKLDVAIDAARTK